MPYDVFFGPAPYVSDNNQEWAQERVAFMNEMKRLESQLALNDTSSAVSPPMHPLDLHHLANQTFAQSTPALKRWFLTAFVAPEDQPLLAPPENSTPIEAQILEINTLLNQAASTGNESMLLGLRDKLFVLFKMNSWIGVGLKLVDEGKISIDLLNTLIQWQAGVLQFDENHFILKNAAMTPFNNTPLLDSQKPLIKTIFATLTLDKDTIMTSSWGIINDREIKAQWLSHWQQTLENFLSILISPYKDIDREANTLNFDLPSAPLLEDVLLNTNKSLILPLYSFGFLAYEDFTAATFLGGRPMQAYLPGARGNLVRAHGCYYGEALITHHDYVHAHVYGAIQRGNANIVTFRQFLQIYALIANALVRNSDNTSLKGWEEFKNCANSIIDDGDLSHINFGWRSIGCKHPRAQQSQQRADYLMIFYNEMALAAGIKLDRSFTCRSMSPDKFQLEAIANGQPLSFTFEMDANNFYREFAPKLYKDFEALKRMSLQQHATLSTPVMFSSRRQVEQAPASATLLSPPSKAERYS